MKRILITGKNSYIGTSFKQWLGKHPDKYKVESISLKDNLWREEDFSKYDVVYHTAGIVHQKETNKNRNLYYKINRDLAYEVAKKAKHDGVKQFIFLSTMSVYGLITGVIDEHTPLNPNTNYGKSKLEAEELIRSLEDNNFKIAILRPPIVYGKGCKGNYPKLAKLAKITPIFPDVDNKRSMIYIDNLNEFVRLLIDNCAYGLFLPQNDEYVNTSELIRLIAQAHGKEIKITRVFNWIIKIGLRMSKTFKKVFGTLIYNKKTQQIFGNLSDGNSINLETVSLEESIKFTEAKEKF